MSTCHTMGATMPCRSDRPSQREYSGEGTGRGLRHIGSQPGGAKHRTPHDRKNKGSTHIRYFEHANWSNRLSYSLGMTTSRRWVGQLETLQRRQLTSLYGAWSDADCSTLWRKHAPLDDRLRC